MRIILTILWALMLFIFTCSVNLQQLVQDHIIDFQLNPSPNWSELFKLDFQWTNENWILRKAGHVLGFCLLALLASDFGRYKSAFYWSIIYALLTEILQLFFFRGGRIYDVMNDCLGILLAYASCILFFRERMKRVTGSSRVHARVYTSSLKSEK